MRRCPCLYRLPLRKRSHFSSGLHHQPILSRQRRDLPAGSQNKASALLFRIADFGFLLLFFPIRIPQSTIRNCMRFFPFQSAICNPQSAIGRWAFQLIPGEGCANKREVLRIDDIVRNEISPPLAGGDEGAGDRKHVEISQFFTLTPTLSRRGRGGILGFLRFHQKLVRKNSGRDGHGWR